MEAPHIGLDLDGLLDEANAFFVTLTRIWPGQVSIITFRDDRDKAIQDLERLQITYHHLHLVDSFDQKAEVITTNDIDVYVDDQPEMLWNVPQNVKVFLFRNEGNFDFETKKWMLSNKTGIIV